MPPETDKNEPAPSSDVFAQAPVRVVPLPIRNGLSGSPDNPTTSRDTVEPIAHERTLLNGLLELASHRTPDELIDGALELIIALTGARQGYLLATAKDGARGEWSAARSLEDGAVDAVRERISSGIIARALSEGRTINTSSAVEDVRFSDRESVKRNAIEAVICSPLGEKGQVGALYLQGCEGVRFPDDALAVVRLFSEKLAPLVESACSAPAKEEEDPTLQLRERLDLTDLVGRTGAMARLFEQIGAVAPLDIDVLITGETGTGKSAIARTIARNSRRKDAPIVELNCAALPDNLIESELFGAAKGAHSTANRDLQGKVGAARGGTLVLDEIGELSLPAQAKLLRLLQERKYFPLGGNEEKSADIRVIACTNVDLQQAVSEGQFREDLYWRLNVVPLRAPTLSERADDVPLLLESAVERSAERHQLRPISISPSARAAAKHAPWPGNVRQLLHSVEAAVVRAVARGASELSPNDLFPEAAEVKKKELPSTPPVAYETGISYQDATLHFQKQFLEQAPAHHRWNVAKTARALDVSRSYLYDLMAAHEISRD